MLPLPTDKSDRVIGEVYACCYCGNGFELTSSLYNRSTRMCNPCRSRQRRECCAAKPVPENPIRTCSKCSKEFIQRPEQFQRCRGICQPCSNVIMRVYRKTEHGRQYFNSHGVVAGKAAALKQWRRCMRLENPQLLSLKSNARNKLHKAVKDGLIIKPTTCSECGSSRRISGHHEDYNKPLDVIWLCVDCHAIRHRKEPVNA